VSCSRSSLSSTISILQGTGKVATAIRLPFPNPVSGLQNCSGMPGSSYATWFSARQRDAWVNIVLCGWCIQVPKGELPTEYNYHCNDRNQTETRTHQSFSLESCGGSTTQFVGVFPYVEVCPTADVLDLVDSGPKFPILEDGRGVVRRG
jgi:hypothetical protein